MAHGANIRKAGEDQVSSIVLSTIKYPTQTNRDNQNEVPSNHPTAGLPPKGVKSSKINTIGSPAISTTPCTLPGQ